jgi:hypothetical protein
MRDGDVHSEFPLRPTSAAHPRAQACEEIGVGVDLVRLTYSVIRAKAAIHCSIALIPNEFQIQALAQWIPAFAGMTAEG